MLRIKVSSAIEDLQRLHEVTGWTPSAAQIRPTAAIRAQKELLLANLEKMWASPADVVCHQIFGTPSSRGPDGRRTAVRPAASEQPRLVPQPFPYDLSAGVHHMVLWCPAPRQHWSDDALTAAIAVAVEERWGGGDFVWYENPKMSVPDPHLYHVQARPVPRYPREWGVAWRLRPAAARAAAAPRALPQPCEKP